MYVLNLGTLELDLTAMPAPVKSAIECDLDQLPPDIVPNQGEEGARPKKSDKPPVPSEGGKRVPKKSDKPPVTSEGGKGVPKKSEKPASEVTLIDLFHKKRVKGWWPVFDYGEEVKENGETVVIFKGENREKKMLMVRVTYHHITGKKLFKWYIHTVCTVCM